MEAITLAELLHSIDRGHGPPGPPEQPVVLIDLAGIDSLSPGDASRLATGLTRSMRVYVGLHAEPMNSMLIGPGQSVLEQLTTTVCRRSSAFLDSGGVPAGATSALSPTVAVADPAASAAAIAEQGRENPGAVRFLDTVLRVAERAAPREVFLVESTGYANLLHGPEYARWRRLRAVDSVGPPADVVTEFDGTDCVVTVRWLTPQSGMDHDLRVRIAEALLAALTDGATSIVLRAEGPDFCARGIADDDLAPDDERTAYLSRLHRHPGFVGWLVHDVLSVEVHGHSSSAGLELMAFAKTATAAAGSTFSVPHVRLGLIFGAGGSASITRRIGRWRTAYLALTGDTIDTTTALRWGLIDAVAPEDAPATRVGPQ